MKGQNSFQRFPKRGEDPESSILTFIEIAQLADIWRSYGLWNVEPVKDGVRVHVGPQAHLHIQKHKIVFHGEHQHESFKAAMQHAQHAWGGEFSVNGSDEFKLKAWVYAQVYGLTVTNYQPPAHMAAEALKLVAQIRAQREAENKTADPILDVPPAAPPSGGAPLGQPIVLAAGTPKSEGVGSGGQRRSSDYVPPYNAVTELLSKVPPKFRAIVDEQLQEVKKAEPKGKWPHVPYHYGMGRIKAYEDRLDKLSEEERKREIAASRARYELHYRVQADLLIVKMRHLGYKIDRQTFEFEPIQKELAPERLVQWQRAIERDGEDGPDRPRRHSRGRSRGRGMSR